MERCLNWSAGAEFSVILSVCLRNCLAYFSQGNRTSTTGRSFNDSLSGCHGVKVRGGNDFFREKWGGGVGGCKSFLWGNKGWVDFGIWVDDGGIKR
jgi:hypothetical protein